jgi:AcrR family transcriptional regulator
MTNQSTIQATNKRRSAQSHAAILDATVKLLGSTGYVDFSIEKVASEAGVGKQTIYRWWSSRADLVLEVWQDRLLPPLAPYDGGSLRDFLEDSLFTFGQQMSRIDCKQAAICVLAEAHRDPMLYKKMEQAVYAPRIELIAEAFNRSRGTGELADHIDPSLAIDSLYGAVWYKILLRSDTVTRPYIKKLIDQAIQGLGT